MTGVVVVAGVVVVCVGFGFAGFFGFGLGFAAGPTRMIFGVER